MFVNIIPQQHLSINHLTHANPFLCIYDQ